MDEPTCSVEGCDKPVRARGMCGTDWDRWRQALKRAGLPLPPKPSRRREPETAAIYALLDPGTREPRYVGHSADPARRLKEHWRRRDYAPTVKDNPRFSEWLCSLDGPPCLRVIQEVPYEDRFAAEEFYTKALRSAPGVDLLNICAGAETADQTRVKRRARMLGSKASAEARAKISAGVRAYFAQLPPAELSEIVARLDHDRTGANNGMFGRKHSPESRLKMSTALRARNRTTGAYDPDDAEDANGR